MVTQDFKSMNTLVQNIVNHKKLKLGEKVQQLMIKQMIFRTETPGVMELKHTQKFDTQFSSVNVNMRIKRPINLGSLDFIILYTNVRKISVHRR